MEQVSVKIYVRYKNHNSNLCITVIVISMLSLSPNIPRKQ